MKNEKEIWDSYNNLLLSDDISRLRKIFARYELFKKTINIPGDIIECGVFKGVSFLFWLKCLKILSPNSSKKVVDTVSSIIVTSTLMSFITVPIIVFIALKYFI